ncbi:MAG TPA: hypothetical protein VFU65_13250 [Actinocrinis sp.]|nr:hypothetical protein [Actinocrinis sp.]
MKLAEIIDLAVRGGAVPADGIRGLTRDEVEKVRETNAQGQALPAAYEEFLIQAGRSFGSIGARFQMCYPDVLEIYTDAHDCDASTLALLEESDVLIGQNFGVNWYWLRAGEPDPPVMSYSEIQRTLRPVVVEPSFSRWLEIVVRMAAPSS